MTSSISIDFELTSTLSLPSVGSYVWTRSPETIPIIAVFTLDNDLPISLDLDPRQSLNVSERALLNAVDQGAEIHAWNAPFEFSVWNNIMRPRFGWPALPIERFHCTMATASCAGLPMSLEDAAEAVGSPHLKSKAGHGLMLRMAKPRAMKGHTPVWWHREQDWIEAAVGARKTSAGQASAVLAARQQWRAMMTDLTAYCVDDVLAERGVQQSIPRMTKREREIWLVDQKMNARGLPVDYLLIDRLARITEVELRRLNTEIALLTNGEVPSASANAALLRWANRHGYPHTSLDKDTLGPFVKSSVFGKLASHAQRVLELRAEAAKTSTSKLTKIRSFAQADGKAHDLVQYGGATRTLRWAGRGPQIQNFPRPGIKHVKEAITQILDDIDPDSIRLLFGKPLDVVSSCLRGVFKASPGKKLVVADYHAIEAIVLGWLAEFELLLDVFRRHEDVYVFTAAGIGSTNRQLGKVLRLACGYGMGWMKFKETAATYNMFLTDAEAQDAVRLFRLANKLIVSLWYACEQAAKDAILNPSSVFTYKKLQFRMANPNGRLKGSLLMELPSGRNLVYRNARIEQDGIVYRGVNQYTRQWEDITTYGGKLVENATQAVARDLLADAIVDIERLFPNVICTTIHDEIVGECNEADAQPLLIAMNHAMTNPAPWADGLPLSTAGAVVERYGKI